MTDPRDDVRRFFDKYIFGYMYDDIQRELDIAVSGTAGNFLCALGLLCYTEFMGGLKLRKFSQSNGEASKRFNTFFDYLGQEYRDFGKQCNVYKVFRCGLAHQYFVNTNEDFTILMLNRWDDPEKSYSYPTVVSTGFLGLSSPGVKPEFEISVPAPIGVGKTPKGRYYMIIEKYFEDFQKASKSLLDELEQEPQGMSAVQNFTFPY